jgi:hypothetical protein
MNKILLVVLCYFLTSPIYAGVTLYTQRTAFNQAVPAQVTIDFEGIAPAGQAVNGDITLDGITFVGFGASGQPSLYVCSSSLPPPGSRDWGTGDTLVGDRFGYFQSSGIPVGYIQATLPPNTYAVGTDYMAVFSDFTKPSTPVLFTVNTIGTSQNFTLNTSPNSAAFAGFVSQSPITSIQYRTLGVSGTGSPYGALDNFTIGTGGVVTSKRYGVNFSASLSTQVGSGSSSSIRTVPVNNRNITQAIFDTGTSGAMKVSDLDVVVDGNMNIEVIRTSGSNVVTTLATTGTNSSQNSIVSASKGLSSNTVTRSDFEFTLPGIPQVQVTNVRITARTNQRSGAMSGLLVSFAGGHGDGENGSTFLQGTVKQTNKVYP